MFKIVPNNGSFKVVDSNGFLVKDYKCEADAVRFVAKNNTSPDIKISMPSKFSITQRFEFLSQLVSMVLTNVSPSLVITGEGGLGKTFSVMSMLQGKEKDVDYVVVKGYSTARGLYNTLCDNSDKIVIFDDCDSILKDSTSLNILKAALDSYDERIISWNSMMSSNDEYPQSFEFTGSIIFISNLSMSSMNQAVISRSLVIDLDMTVEDKIERMESILPNVLPELTMEIKSDAFGFLVANADKCKDLNMRTLIKVCKIRNSFPENWEDLAMYSMAV